MTEPWSKNIWPPLPCLFASNDHFNSIQVSMCLALTKDFRLSQCDQIRQFLIFMVTFFSKSNLNIWQPFALFWGTSLISNNSSGSLVKLYKNWATFYCYISSQFSAVVSYKFFSAIIVKFDLFFLDWNIKRILKSLWSRA